MSILWWKFILTRSSIEIMYPSERTRTWKETRGNSALALSFLDLKSGICPFL